MTIDNEWTREIERLNAILTPKEYVHEYEDLLIVNKSLWDVCKKREVQKLDGERCKLSWEISRLNALLSEAREYLLDYNNTLAIALKPEYSVSLESNLIESAKKRIADVERVIKSISEKTQNINKET